MKYIIAHLHPYPWRNHRAVATALNEGYLLILTLILLWLGINFLMPFSTVAGSPSWHVMVEWAGSEEVLGARFLFGAFLGVIAFLSPRFWWRAILTSLVANAHMATAAMLLIGNPTTPATLIYALIALGGYGVVWLMVWDRSA